MSIDIIILSYNRPKQLQRILDNFMGVVIEGVNLIIKDDCSPQIDDIEELYIRYKDVLKINLALHKNTINLGYDMNLLDCFNIGNSKYIFLLSNDDYIDASCLSKLLDFLNRENPEGVICSYKDKKTAHRTRKLECDGKYTVDLLYDSILFSGLIFDRSISRSIAPHLDFLKNCIYSQVFIFALMRKNNLKLLNYPDELLILGGDGENYFGKNISSTGENDLTDRTNLLSNFRYQLRLIKVVEYIDAKLFLGFSICFQKEYSRRLLGYLLKLRGTCSSQKYMELHKVIFSAPIYFTSYFYSYTKLIRFIPRRLSYEIYLFGTRTMRKSG